MKRRMLERKLNTEIGKLIKARREALDLTQVALGRKLGYQYGNYIAMIEAGNAAFPFERWMDYADALDVPRHEFLRLVMLELFPETLDYISGFRSLEEKREEEKKRIGAEIRQKQSRDEKRDDKEGGDLADIRKKRQKDKLL